MTDDITNIVSRIMETQAERLEIFAAAFLKEVGSEKATEYVLCQQLSGPDGICKWWFEKKEAKHG